VADDLRADYGGGVADPAARRARDQADAGLTGGVIVRQVAGGDRKALCRCTQPALCSPPVPSLDGFERAFARGERELPLLKALKGAIIAAKPLESDVCRLTRTSHSNAGRPNDRQDQMAIRGLLGGTLFMTVGAIVPAGAQTPPSSPAQAPQVAQVPGKTPQERCYYRYMTAHGYHHVGPKAHAACPDPNQEQPNN
jgi:hypothetical protein